MDRDERLKLIVQEKTPEERVAFLVRWLRVVYDAKRIGKKKRVTMYNQARPVRRLRAANENASSFASKVPTITKPINDGVLNLTKEAPLVPKGIKLWPILLGADEDAASMRIIGWHQVLLDGSTTLWFPSILGEFACTASTAIGIAGAAVLNTERFCDVITPVAARLHDRVIAAGTALNSNYEVLSPANDTPGYIIMPLDGFELLEITSDQTTNTPTFNCLFSLFD